MGQIRYHRVNHSIVASLKQMVGDQHVITKNEDMIDYSHDEYAATDIPHLPEAVVIPMNAEEVAEIIRPCNRVWIPITPRGGGTGLCGGCVFHKP